MNIPEWLKPGIYGAAIGAVCVTAVGFSWGGWMTNGSANKMASAMAHENVIAALTPVCLDMARTDPDRTAQPCDDPGDVLLQAARCCHCCRLGNSSGF